MGTDCALLTEKGRTHLDRLYTFDDEIIPGMQYSKVQFNTILDRLECKIADDYPDEIDYRRRWISMARENVGYINIVFSEHQDGYFLASLVIMWPCATVLLGWPDDKCAYCAGEYVDGTKCLGGTRSAL